MGSPDTNPRYENVHDDAIDREHCTSVKYYNAQSPYSESMIVGHTYCSIPPELAQDIPDVVTRISNGGQEPLNISGVEQIIINDDIYYCPLDNTKPSAIGSNDEDIYETNA